MKSTQKFVGFVVRGLTFGGNLYRSFPEDTFEGAWASAQKIEATLKSKRPNGLGSSTLCGVQLVDKRKAMEITEEYQRFARDGYYCS